MMNCERVVCCKATPWFMFYEVVRGWASDAFRPSPVVRRGSHQATRSPAIGATQPGPPRTTMPEVTTHTGGRPASQHTTWLLSLAVLTTLVEARDMYSGPVPVNETWPGRHVPLPDVGGIDYSYRLTEQPEPDPPQHSLRQHEPRQTLSPEEFRRIQQQEYIKKRVENLRSGHVGTTTMAPTTPRSHPHVVDRLRRQHMNHFPWLSTSMDEILEMAEASNCKYHTSTMAHSRYSGVPI